MKSLYRSHVLGIEKSLASFPWKKKKKALSGKLKRNGVELKTNSVVFDKAFYVL